MLGMDLPSFSEDSGRVECPGNQGLRLESASLNTATTSRTKQLMLDSPNDPTRAVNSAGEVGILAEFCHNLHRFICFATFAT